MTSVSFALPEKHSSNSARELLAIQGATAIVCELLKTHAGLFFVDEELDGERLGKAIIAVRAGLEAEISQKEMEKLVTIVSTDDE